MAKITLKLTPEQKQALRQPVDVTLPNGLTLNLFAPFGTDPEAFKSKVLNQYHQDAAAGLFDPTSASSFENFLAGIGRGFVNTGRNISNITGFMSDDDLRQKGATDKALLDTSAGFWGDLVGSVLALAPAAGPISGALKVASKLPLLGRLGGATALGAGEGALGGYVFSDPETRKQNAAIGAAFGGTLTNALGVATRRFKTPIEPSDAAKEVMARTGQTVPTANFPKSEAARESFNTILTSLPGAAQNTLQQLRAASNAWRRNVIDPQALPLSFGKANSWPANMRALNDADKLKSITADVVDDLSPDQRVYGIRGGEGNQAVKGVLQDAWEKTLADKPWLDAVVAISPDDGKTIQGLLGRYQNIVGRDTARMFRTDRMSGQDFLSLRDHLQAIINNLKGLTKSKSDPQIKIDLQAAQTLRATLPDIMEDGLNNIQRNAKSMRQLQSFQDYKQAVTGGAYRARKMLEEVSDKAAKNAGDYDYKALSQAADKRGGLLKHEAKVGAEALFKASENPGLFKAMATAGV